MISVTITDKDGSSSVQQFENEKTEILIGRVKGNDIVLPKTNVSKRHSRIIVKDGRPILIDLKSTNGTFVNGQKITAPKQLVEGDKVFIGDFTLEVREIATAAPAAPAAPAGISSPAPLPSFGQVPGVGAGLPVPPVEAPRPLSMGGTPSLSGLPSLGGSGLPPVGGGLPSLGGVGAAPMGPASSPAPMGPGAAPAPSIPSMSNLPPVGGLGAPAPVSPAPAPMGPGAGLGASPSLMGPGAPAPVSPAPAPMGPASSPAPMGPASTPAPMGPGAGLGASPLPSAHGVSPLSGLGAGNAEPASKPAREGVIDKSLRASAPAALDRPAQAAAPASIRKQEKAPAARVVPAVSATLPEDIIVDDGRNNESDARIKAARIVMDAYLAQVDFQTLVSQPYPPEPDIQDACYAQLANIANANRASLGNVNIDDLTEFLLREVCGLGAIDALIDDEQVTDFTVYNCDTIVAERNGRREISALQFTNADMLYLAAQRILSFQGLNEQNAPAISEVRLGDGTQIEVVLSPVAVSSTCIVVRKTCRKFNALQALVQKDVLSNEMSKFLLLAVKARRNILVVGAQGSGRTGILNALGSEIPDGERIVTVENSAMMLMPQLYVLSLEAQNATYGQGGDLASLIRQTSKLRAERVLVDSIQSPADASAFVSAIFAGAQGSMATLSALSAFEAFNNFQKMVSADNATAGLAQVAGAIDLVVSTKAFCDGRRRIVEIAEVAKDENGALILVPIYVWDEAGMGNGQFKATGEIPAFYQALERGGVSLDPSIFNV